MKAIHLTSMDGYTGLYAYTGLLPCHVGRGAWKSALTHLYACVHASLSV